MKKLFLFSIVLFAFAIFVNAQTTPVSNYVFTQNEEGTYTEISGGTIDDIEHTVTLEVETGTNVTALTPTIEISEYATINPENETEQDFTEPVEYIVPAENGDEQVWTVTITEKPNGVTDLSVINIEIYPNPATNFVTIEADSKIKNIYIYNTVGQIVSVSKLHNLSRLNGNFNTSKVEIDVSNMQAGFYILNIKTKNGISVKKLIVQ